MEVRRASAGAQSQLSGDRTLETRMDEYLHSLGFYRKKIAKDGSCLFRAVAEQVLHCQALHTDVRIACVKYLKQNRSTYELFIEGDFEKYLENLEDPQSWVGQVEITALAEIYKHDFIIFQEPDQPPVNITESDFPDKVRLCFLNGNHYDSVYPRSFEKSAAVCQSILYELLYNGVCDVDRSVLAPCMKAGRGRDRLDSEECKSSEESDLEEDEFWSSEVKEKTISEMKTRPAHRGRGRGRAREGGREHLSAKVQKSLNPALYRNVEYDVWLRSKRIQQQRDFCMAAGMQYSVGDKCKVQLGGSNRLYSAYVQEVKADNGPVTVFIEELGKQHTVPLLNLRLPSEDSQSWQKVSEKSKRHPAPNNGQTASEWENRGGRRSGKPHSASGGRAHRQHSWPPQNTADEQTTVRGKIRRSDQRSSPVIQEEEEENTLLELLQKDEHNFPSLGTNPQTVTAGEVIKRGGDKNSSRKKDHRSSETDLTETPQKPVQSQENNITEKHERREPGQKSSPPNKEKSVSVSLSPAVTLPSAPKSAPASSHTNTPAAPHPDKRTPKTNPVYAKSRSAFNPVTVSSPSTSVPAPVPAAVLSTAQPNQPTPPQNTPVSSSVLTQVTPSTPVQTPASVSEIPLSVSTPDLIPAPAVPETPSAPDQVTDPILHTSDSPPSRDTAPPIIQHTVEIPTTHVHPATDPAHVLPPATDPAHVLPPATDPAHVPPPDTLNSSEPRPCESLPTPALGASPAPDHLSQPQQLLYPPQWSQLLQDPLYPGFPQNEKGEVETLPPYSLSQKGEDLPQDINVLRFFFNLGIKAYSQPLWPPISYLGPLTQVYQMYRRAPPPSSNSPSNPTSMTPWQPENPPPPQNLSSIPNISLESQSHAPVAPAAVSSASVGSADVGGYHDHPQSIQMHVPPRPAVPWSASPAPSSYAEPYPVPPYPPPGNQMYPPSSVGFQHLPPPEAINHHGRMDVLPYVAPPLLRAQENGQRSMTPQFGSLQEAACFPVAQPHLGGSDFKPVNIPVSMSAMSPSSFVPVGQPFPLGSLHGDIPGFGSLPNGRPSMSLHTGPVVQEPARLIQAFMPEDEQEFDLKVGQSFYSQSYRSGGRRGQNDRGGYRGRGHRGRKEYSGRGRQDGQLYGDRGHYLRQGAGPRVGSR